MLREASFHQTMMRLAILMARPGKTFPNPAVGCVITKNQKPIGLGATSGLGGCHHAEEVALAQAGADAKGATVYITLEPCAKRSKGLGGCAVKLRDQGIKTLYYACHDPSALANHHGPALLKEAGIDVYFGLLEKEAEGLIRPWRYFLTHGRPLISVIPSDHPPLGMDAPLDLLDGDIEVVIEKHLSLGHRHLWIGEDHPSIGFLTQLGWI
jgi:pyrimidine deaminase RibD-like protein